MNKIKKYKRGPKKGIQHVGTNPYSFGRTLAQIRRKKGLSQTEFGEVIGVTKRSISYYERELPNPSMELIKKVSKALNISPKIFLETPEDTTQETRVSLKLLKRLELAKTLSPKAQKSLTDYIDMLVKADGQ